MPEGSIIDETAYIWCHISHHHWHKYPSHVGHGVCHAENDASEWAAHVRVGDQKSPRGAEIAKRQPNGYESHQEYPIVLRDKSYETYTQAKCAQT